MSKEHIFKINGVEISAEQQILTALEILRLAKEKEAIPGEPEKYILQGEKGNYNNDDQVDLDQDYLFIAIPNAPTPVA